MNNLFPPINESLFLADATKLITTPAWIQWLNAIGSSGHCVKVFSLDLATETTTGVVHGGAGFKPSAVVIIGSIQTDVHVSIGFSDFSSHFCVATYTTGTWVFFSTTPCRAYTGSDGDTDQTLSNLVATADGFTATWTKVGSPTGTFSYAVLFLR
jgi:hypothetical protein